MMPTYGQHLSFTMNCNSGPDMLVKHCDQALKSGCIAADEFQFRLKTSESHGSLRNAKTFGESEGLRYSAW